MLYFCEECGASRGCEEWCRAAIVGSHAERQDRETGLGPKDGRAVREAKSPGTHCNSINRNPA